MLHSKLHPIVRRISIKENLYSGCHFTFKLHSKFTFAARQGGDILLICVQLKYTFMIHTNIYFAFCEIETARFIVLGLVDPFNFANFMMIVFYPGFNGNYLL